MAKITQKQRVKRKLLDDGEVTNAWAIENHIWRLGAVIHDLRVDPKLGWTIETKMLPHNNCQYRLVTRPKRMVGVVQVDKNTVKPVYA